VLFEGTGNVLQQSSSLAYDDTAKAFIISANQNASTGITISNTTSGTNATGTLLFQSNGLNQSLVQKFSSNSTPYKIVAANDFLIYNSFHGGDIAILNDNPGGRIKLTAGSGSVSQFTIATTGNILIGTTTDAGFKLDVNGTARVNGNAQFGTGFYWNNTNGRLGIGTSTPAYDIDIEKTFAGDNFLKVSNPSTNALARSGVILYTTDNVSPAIFGKAGQNNPAYKIIAPNDAFFFGGGGTNNNDFAFLIDKATGRIKFAAGGSATAQMTIGANGNVLINTTTDAGFRLDVNGTARVQDNLTIAKAGAAGLILNDTSNGNVPFFAMQQGGTTKVLFEAGVGLAGRLDIGVSGSRVFTLGAGGTFGVTIGRTYVGTAAPTDGLLVQGNVGIATTSPNASAQLDVVSTTKGFLPPRMTTTQRNAIASPAAGLQVFDTTLNMMSYYNGTIWISF
jgi:hypothetical protein